MKTGHSLWTLFEFIVYISSKMKTTKDITLLTFLALPFFSYGKIQEECRPTQFLENGETGMIKCFHDEVYSTIVWYDSTDIFGRSPIINCIRDVHPRNNKCVRGMYSVDQNGSLVIGNVSIEHEGTFTVLKFKPDIEEPTVYAIHLIVTVKPSSRCPLINLCHAGQEVCMAEVNSSTDIVCSIHDSRPKIYLYWMKYTTGVERNVSSQMISVTENNMTISSYSTLNEDILNTNLLSVLTCKASNYAQQLDCPESSVLILQKIFDYQLPLVEKIFALKGSNVEMNCNYLHHNNTYLLWRRVLGDRFENIGFVIQRDTFFQKVLMDSFELNHAGSLMIHTIQTHHEGQYFCIDTDGVIDRITTYKVHVYVTPYPAYPVVDGCNDDQFCVLDVTNRGTLRCVLNGVWPKVTLFWKTFHEKDSEIISFTDTNLEITFNGDTYDVMLTSLYKINWPIKNRITLVCESNSHLPELPHWSTKFELLFLSASDVSTNSPQHPEHDPSFDKPQYVLPVALIVSLGFCSIVGAFIIIKVRSKRKKQSTGNLSQKEQMEPMIAKNNVNTSKLDTFLQELRTSYEKQYNSIRPVPFMLEKTYNIDDIYVESGIEVRETVRGTGSYVWTRQHSYYSLFMKASSDKSLLRIVEGDPGQGKSTLALKLVQEWCERKSQPYLANVDILIFLKLRHLGTMKSIFHAIKMILLPKDTALSTDDIEIILKTSMNIAFILDGYDEFTLRDENSDINDILKRNMFQKALVLLTTRSNCYPKEITPQVFVVRMTGFDDKAGDAYIRKAVTDDLDIIKRIKKRLNDNPIVAEFCVVPLFFSMYAHVLRETDENVEFHSVTKFFRYIVSCLHSHLHNKLEDDNGAEKDFVKTHEVLDEVAFEGLSSHQGNVAWHQEDICLNLGHDLYNYYIKTGILVAEKIRHILDKPGISESDHIQEIIEVRFYHKLFCEWYAAHFLSKSIERATEDTIDTILSDLDPFDVQYLYRFSCGLNEKAASKIIPYLQRLSEGDRFAILCILEQTGHAANIANSVKKLCLETILLSNESSRLLQRSTLQLIDVAKKLEIQIRCLHFENCFSHVDVPRDCIVLTSNLHIGQLALVKRLNITDMGRELPLDETIRLIRYACHCVSLKEVRFECCLLPPLFLDDDVLKELKGTNVRVSWIPLGIWYHLTSTGEWKVKHGDALLSESEYLTLVREFRLEWRNTPWQIARVDD